MSQSADDLVVGLLVPPTEAARAEPAVDVERRGGGLRQAQVPGRDYGPVDAQLAGGLGIRLGHFHALRGDQAELHTPSRGMPTVPGRLGRSMGFKHISPQDLDSSP